MGLFSSKNTGSFLPRKLVLTACSFLCIVEVFLSQVSVSLFTRSRFPAVASAPPFVSSDRRCSGRSCCHYCPFRLLCLFPSLARSFLGQLTLEGSASEYMKVGFFPQQEQKASTQKKLAPSVSMSSARLHRQSGNMPLQHSTLSTTYAMSCGCPPRPAQANAGVPGGDLAGAGLWLVQHLLSWSSFALALWWLGLRS